MKIKPRTVLLSIVPPIVILSIVGICYSKFSKGTDEAVIEPALELPPQEEVKTEVSETETSETVSPATEPTPTEIKTIEEKPPKTPEKHGSLILPERSDNGTQPPGKDYYQAIITTNAEALSANELWRKFAAHPENLNVLVKVIDQLANGNRPLAAGDLGIFPLPASFKAVDDGKGGYVEAPESMERFSAAVEAVCSVSAVNTYELLELLEPELDRIVRENLGYPQEDTFRSLLKEALHHVLDTPEQDSPPSLIKLTNRLFRYQNEALEELTDAQKFMLRLGPDNQKKLFAHLRNLVGKLQ